MSMALSSSILSFILRILGLVALQRSWKTMHVLSLARFSPLVRTRARSYGSSCSPSDHASMKYIGSRFRASLRMSTNIDSTDTKESFFITTPIYYVNGDPHLGHAYTSVVSDVIARFQRKDGKDVIFLTGTDEHGQKVEQSATKFEKSPLEFADEMSAKFRTLVAKLDCSADDFIRTTEERHKVAVHALWNTLKANDQIYLGAYEGWYSVRDEAFYSEGELVDGKAPTGAEVEWVKEESYFFRLSQWTEKLLEFYESNPDFIGPRSRFNEVTSFVKQEGGLKDLSISRTTFAWGIPVPNDPKHVIYVWLDALTNYLSALGYPNTVSAGENGSSGSKVSTHWPASLHIVGKDILRFHAIFWPAFLLAAGLPPPKRVYAHGWWTKDGEKMSKSVGNVLDPFELLDKYGVDYLRYYLTAEINFGNDGDFADDIFRNRINSDLADDLGNLAQRVLTMVNKHCDGVIPQPGALASDTASSTSLVSSESFLSSDILLPEDKALLQMVRDALPQIRACVNEQQNLKGMCEVVITIAKAGNKYIDTQAPWKLVTTDKERFYTVMLVLSELLRGCAVMLEPVMPTSCATLLDQLGVPTALRSFSSMESGAMILPGTKISSPSPVFPKLEAPITENASHSKGGAASGKGKEPKKSPGKKKGANSSGGIPEGMTFPQYDTLSLTEVEEKIVAVGNQIRKMKAEKAAKEDLLPFIAELTFAKCRYQELNEGAPYTPKVQP